jgi:hypothetical protein
LTNACRALADAVAEAAFEREVLEDDEEVVDRLKPTFMAALRISTLSRVRLTSSGPEAVFIVLEVLLLPCEYPDRLEELEDQRACERPLSVPRTRMLGIEGEWSSGEMGVSSNSVVGVSGIMKFGSARSISLGKLEILLAWV